MTPAAVHIEGEEHAIVPRWMVAVIVAVLVLLLVADVGAQFVPGSGHKADPLLDGALLTIIGGVIAASRGPQPGKTAELDPATGQEPATPSNTGRHRTAPEDQP